MLRGFDHVVNDITRKKRSNLTKEEIANRNIEFALLMNGLPEGTYPIPKLAEFINKKIPGFRNKNTVRKTVIEWVENYRRSALDPIYKFESSRSLQILVKIDPQSPSGSLQGYLHKEYYRELLQ